MNAVSAKLETAKPYLVSLSARDQTWRADEPPDRGGGDLGPTPVEMFLGSLCACTAITVSMYAGRKAWPLERVEVSMAYRRLSPEEAAEVGSSAATVTEISVDLKLQGALSEEQLVRLREIAGRCPVKRTVEGDIRFRTVQV